MWKAVASGTPSPATTLPSKSQTSSLDAVISEKAQP